MPHKEEATTQAGGIADIATPSQTVAVDSSCLSTQCGCEQTEDVTSCAKPQ